MELVPDTPTSVRHRIGDISERKQGTARGTRTKNCRTAVRQIGNPEEESGELLARNVRNVYNKSHA